MRRRPLAIALLLVALPLLAAAAAAAWLVQPLAGSHPPRPLPLPVEPPRLEEHVRALALRFAPRDHEHVGNLDRAAAYVRDALTAAGGRLSEQAWTAAAAGGPPRRYRNVVARFGPEAGARVVVGAHYDAAGPWPGADDNASGVAGLLELGRLLGATRDLAAPVELVAFALEEPPFFETPHRGSRVHAAALRREGVGLRAMIALEMIGCFRDEEGSQGFPSPLLRLLYPGRGDFVAVVGTPGAGDVRLVRRVKAAMRGASRLPVRSINAPRAIPGIDFSDHASYWEAGYRAVMVTDTAFYRNPRYHTPDDLPATLDYARMAEVVAGVYQAVLALAG